MRLLLIEDEPELAAALKDALTRHDILVDHVACLADAEDMAARGLHDVVVLDRKLPDGDGLSLIPKLRAGGNLAPVLVLSVRAELPDRVTGLDHGADDYLAKPFALEELLARLRALLRRPQALRPDAIRVGRLSFDLVNREARVGSAALDLTRREILVLEALSRRAGRMVPRDVLMEAVFASDDDVQPNALDTQVSRLRRKLAEAGGEVVINVVRGIGYLMREAS